MSATNSSPRGPLSAVDLLRLTELKLGESRSSHWLRSMVRKGLLAPPHPHGRPGQRGGRRPGTWSSAEVELFEAVLARIRLGDRQRELCDIVARDWLAGGVAVDTDQLRRALRTYRDAPASRRARRRTGLELAESLAEGPGMSRTARRRYIDAFDAALSLETYSVAALDSPAFNPDGVGPGRFRQLISPKSVLGLIDAWRAGCNALDGDRDCFQDVRVTHARIERALAEPSLHSVHGSDLSACSRVLLTVGVLTGAANRLQTPRSTVYVLV